MIVTWHDAQTLASWTPQNEFVERELPEVKTVGVVAGATKVHIAIAQSIADDDCDGIRIPLGWIESIEVVRKPKKGK